MKRDQFNGETIMKKMERLILFGFLVCARFLVHAEMTISYEGQIRSIQNKLAYSLGAVDLENPSSINDSIFVLNNVTLSINSLMEDKSVVPSATKKKIEKAISTIKNALEVMQKNTRYDKTTRKQRTEAQLQLLEVAHKSMKTGILDVSKTPRDLKDALYIAIESFINNMNNVMK